MDVTLCDGESIEYLKANLNEETIKYNEAMEELDNLMKKMHEAAEDRKYNLANHYDFKSECKADDVCDILYKIRDIEESIKALEPEFKSSIETPEFAK